MKTPFACFLTLAICVASAGADELTTKHAAPQQMGQDFIDNPPACYPASTQAWKDEYPNGPIKNRVFAAIVSCDGISKKLGREYYATGGGITHHRNSEARPNFTIPEWYPIQMQPAVPGPGPHPIKAWRCSFATANDKIKKDEFTCTISCCLNVKDEDENSLPQRMEASMPNLLEGRYVAKLFDWGVNVVRVAKDSVPPLKREAEKACGALVNGGNRDYKPVAYFAPVYGNFTVNIDGYLAPFPDNGNRPNVGNGGDQDPNYYVTKVLCDLN